MMMAATCLLQKNSRPTEADIEDALEGNLCRCTGYVHIVDAVKQAAAVMNGAAR
jgi:carbon-monoxide dehydrogenase small subunit